MSLIEAIINNAILEGLPTAAELGAEEVINKSTNINTDAASNIKYPSVKAVKDYTDGLVLGLLDDRGNYDASSSVFPSTGGSGTGGAVVKGDIWVIAIAGTIGGLRLEVGDSIRALSNTPGQTVGNWDCLNHSIGYTPENLSNKVTSVSGASTDVQYPSAKLVYDQLTTKSPINPRVLSIVSSATPTINTDNYDIVTITAQAVNITSMTTNLTGAPTEGTSLVIRIKDDGVSRNITWGAKFVTGLSLLPSATVAGTVLVCGFMYDSVAVAWRCEVAGSGGVSDVVLTKQAVGFTAVGGVVPKTLTVPLDASVSGTNTGDNASNTSSVAKSGDTLTGNLSIVNLTGGYTTTVTSAGTKTLAVTSTYYQVFTGSSTHSVTLPDARTLAVGHRFYIDNNSTSAVALKNNGSGTTLLSVTGLCDAFVICTDVSTQNGTWDFDLYANRVASGKILNVSNSLTLAGTDGSTLNVGTGGTLGTAAYTAIPTYIAPRVLSLTSSATPAIDVGLYDAVDITALGTAITSMTSGLSGSPVNKQTLFFEIKDDGTAREISWGTSFVAGGVALPTTTVLGKILSVGFRYSTANSLNKWRCVASAQEA